MPDSGFHNPQYDAWKPMVIKSPASSFQLETLIFRYIIIGFWPSGDGLESFFLKVFGTLPNFPGLLYSSDPFICDDTLAVTHKTLQLALIAGPACTAAGSTGHRIISNLVYAHLKAFAFALFTDTACHSVTLSFAARADCLIAGQRFEIPFPLAVPTAITGKRNFSISITLTTGMPLRNSYRHALPFVSVGRSGEESDLLLE